MSIASLTLYAEHDGPHVDHDRLIEYLYSIGLTGSACGPECYLSGPKFFHHLTFLGCAPNLTLDPNEGNDYLRIIIPRLTEPRLFVSASVRPPRCPDCKSEIVNWHTELLHSNNGKILCAECGKSQAVSDLNLRKRACYSSCVIRITPVFESEAIPANGLLEALGRVLGARFAYAYTES